jgi:hypothetical protein
MGWSRQTKWRQGKIIQAEHLRALGVDGIDPELKLAMAISHDCDIANDNLDVEPFVEFVLGRSVEKIDRNKEFGKNPRELHLKAQHVEAPIFLDFYAPQKIKISKELLVGLEPDDNYFVEDSDLLALRGWLAARYRRHAFPDSFNERFYPIAKALEEKAKKNPSGIIGYWVDYQPRDIELPVDEPYELWLYIVCAEADQAYIEKAEELAIYLNSNFPKLKEKSKASGDLDIRECAAYSEREFTLADMRALLQYHLEYISYRVDPPGPIA